MNETSRVATASETIEAPQDSVWKALVDPKMIKQYMFGTHVTTDWRVGGPITFKGEWQGQHYEDKGTVLEVSPGERLRYSHFSPLSGLPDTPENYHNVTIELLSEGDHRTRVTLSQDNNPTEEARKHSEDNWKVMLGGLKTMLES